MDTSSERAIKTEGETPRSDSTSCGRSGLSGGSKRDGGLKRDKDCEQMDTNNNNNRLEEDISSEADARSSSSKGRSRNSVSRPGVASGNETGLLGENGTSSNDPLLSNASISKQASDSQASTGLPSHTGTPTSISQLLALPNSGFSLEGFDFTSPNGSGTFSPLTSARLGRKRAHSISPLSSSSLDLNNLIRTSPNSLATYIANSRGSSAGSIGHLSPSLFTNSTHFQASYARPLQFSLNNAAYPLPNSTGTSSSTVAAKNGDLSAPTSTPNQVPPNADHSAKLHPMHIKKEVDSEGDMFNGQPSDFNDIDNSMQAVLSQNLHQLKQEPLFFSEGSQMETNHGLSTSSLRMELNHANMQIPALQNGLETLHEEMGGDSSDEEGMQTDPTEHSSAFTENDSEIDSKANLKTTRIYFSYPPVEEPHNNCCKWGDCDKDCSSLDELVRHVNSDHIYRDSKKDFVCFWSGCVREKRPFKAQYMLLVHMRRHTGEKPHKCNYEGCNKAYSRLENLKTHVRSHTGERPYMCKYEGCGKAFSNASDCAKHMNRTHSDEKPYACPNTGCTKRYTDPSSRRKHMKNCQVSKKARTDDHDADEESAAETSTIAASCKPSSSSSSSSSKKSYRQPKKPSDKKKGALHHPHHAPPSTSSTPSGSQGYASGGSQGYAGGSSQTGDYNSSGYETEYTGYIPDHEDEITQIFQQQTISDPTDGLSPHTTFPSADTRSLLPPPAHSNIQQLGPSSIVSGAGVSYDHHMTHQQQQLLPNGTTASSHDRHMTPQQHPNVRASRQKRGGGLVLPAGHPQQQQQQQQTHQQQHHHHHPRAMTTALQPHPQHPHFQQHQQMFGNHLHQRQAAPPPPQQQRSYRFYHSVPYSNTHHSFEGSHSQPLPHSHLHPSTLSSQLTQHSSTQPILPVNSDQAAAAGAAGGGGGGGAGMGQINPSNPQHSAHGGSADFGTRNFLAKGNGTPASSGYSSLISRKSPSDIDESSVISSSYRSNSLHANSYSTFSSNSSRVSSPCSNSGRSDTLRPPHPSQPLMPYMVPKPPTQGGGGGIEAGPTTTSSSGSGSGYPLRQTLRMNHPGAYQSRHNLPPHSGGGGGGAGGGVRQSDETSESSRSTRQYSSHSSRYSFSGSELSDELLDSLPSSRRNSFTKSTPLPLPESMQRQFSEGLDFHSGTGTSGDDNMGMEFSPPSNSGGGGSSYHGNHQIQLSGLSDSSQTSDQLQPTLPLHHFDTSSGGGGFTQSLYGDSASNESYDVLFSEVRAMSPPNMVLGDMASFANTLPEETHYLEEILNGPVK